MPSPVNMTEQENRMLQDLFLETYSDDRVRSLEGPIILGILKKFELWPSPPTFTEQENRRIQYMFREYDELVTPYPYPYSPLTFGQDTRQLTLVKSILVKIKAAQ